MDAIRSPARRPRKARTDPPSLQVNLSLPPDIALRFRLLCEQKEMSFSQMVITWIEGSPDYREPANDPKQLTLYNVWRI